MSETWSRASGHGGCSGGAELASELVFEGLVLGSQPTDLLPVGVKQLAKGVDGGPLRCGSGWSSGGWRLPEPVDLRSNFGLAVEPGAGDACCPGEASEADWLAAASEGPESLAGPGQRGVVAGLGCSAERFLPVSLGWGQSCCGGRPQ